MEYLPPIPPELPCREFIQYLDSTIEEASQRLSDEVYGAPEDDAS